MRRVDPLSVYVLTVCAAGLPLTAWMLAGSFQQPRQIPWLLVTALMLTLFAWQYWGQVRRGRNNAHVMLTISDTFTLALIAVAPPALAFVGLAVPSAVDAVFRKTPWYKTAFNFSLFTLLICAARATFCLLSGDAFFSSPGIRPDHLLPVLAMGLVYCIGNELLLQPVIAMAGGEPLRSVLMAAARMVGFNRVVDISMSLLALAATTVFGPLALIFLFPAIIALWRKTQMAAERERAAWHDSLTGLPNLQLLQKVYLERDHEGAGDIAVLLVGLDRFDGINEALGHEAADVLLFEVAQRLRQNVREGDVVARRGGDVFAVLAPVTGSSDPQLLAERLLTSLRASFSLSGVRVDIQATIGAAISTGLEQSAEDLLGEAGAALRIAKATDRGSWRLYRSGDNKSSPDQLSLLGDLRKGIENGDLELHYQPKMDVGTQRVHGLEALVRWRRDGELVPPYSFIPLAEQTGLIGALTWNVVDQALAQVGSWRRAGRSLSIAINLASAQLMDPATPARILAALSAHQVPAHLLTLEVTEGTIVGDEVKAAVVLGQLRSLGIHISIDDYGTGYSSLTYLQRLSVDEIKIDRSFIEHLGRADNAGDRAIVKSTIALAKELSLSVVAEGAEDQAAVDVLASLGCDFIQGFHYSRPLPAAELEAWLDARREGPASAPPSAGPVTEPARVRSAVV